jgi:DnaJ-class molecular chaperone
MAEDFYKTLEVARDASQEDIQKAYRRLARKFHPDLHPDDKGAKKKFQEVQAAFDVLNDPKKRELYNQYGSSYESVAAGAQPGGTGQWRSATAGPDVENFDFSQFFGDRFGGGEAGGGFADIFTNLGGGRAGKQSRRGRGSARQPGADLESALEIPFNIAVTGGQAHVSVQRPSGKVDTIAVKIPAGIDEGKKIRLRGQGEPGSAGGPNGDILITIHVAAHPSFRRRGDDLEVRLPVTLAEAAEGAKVDVPTPRGTVALRVPPGTSSGARLRIKGHGVTRSGKPAGDLYAEIAVTLPKKLDDSEIAQIREMCQRHPSNPRADLKW